MNLELSVIIPTYRRTGSLKRLLQLLERQSIADKMEVLVIDQNRLGFLESEIQISRFPRVRQIMQEKPNASLARNTGFQSSKGKFVLFLDDDLVPEVDFCQRGLEFFGLYDFVECFVPSLKANATQEPSALENDKRVIKRWDKNVIEITDAMSAALFVQRDAFYRSGGFDVLLFDFAKTAEDQEFFLRFHFKGIRLFYTPAISIVHDESQDGGCDLRTVDYWVTREKCIRSWVYRYKIHGGRGGTLSFSSWMGLSRSVFLNRSIVRIGLKGLMRQVFLLRKAIEDTDDFLQGHWQQYSNPRLINHLKF